MDISIGMEPIGRDIWTEQMMSGELKEAINLFIWQWGYPELTLSQAEKIAVGIFDMLSVNPNECIKHHDSITVNVENFLKS
jgi:hypothetical protein